MAPDQRRRSARGSGDELRAEIVAAARTLLEETGSEDAVTLRAIARHVGITAPAIYAHFSDLDAVLLEVVRGTFAELTAALRASLDGKPNALEGLQSACSAYVDFGQRLPHRYRVLFGRYGTARTPGMTDKRETGELAGAEAFGVLVAAVTACVEEGYSASESPVEDAVALWAALHGYTSLQSSVPAFPWPSATLEVLISRIALIRQ